MPRDAVSRTANVERNGGHKWVNIAGTHSKTATDCEGYVNSNYPQIKERIRRTTLIELCELYNGLEVDALRTLFSLVVSRAVEDRAIIRWETLLLQ